MKARRTIAIIGAGFSGAAVAAQLLKQRGRAAANVILIERHKRFGPGRAYGGNERAHLLNVRASNLSAFPDAPDDFVRWLNRRERGDQRNSFAPRFRYGAYIENVVERAAFGAWGRLKRIRADALACRPATDKWEIQFANQDTVAADAVVLAMGNLTGVTPPIFEANDVAVFDAWDPQAVQPLRRGGDVLMIGVGLTMIDLALTLARDKRVGTIYALSRRGLIPRSHLKNAASLTPEPLAFPAELSEALHAFRREVRATTQRGEPWQHAIDGLRSRTPALWRALTPEQQRRFLRHLRPWWDVHRHRAAPEIAAQVAKLQASGRLRILAGEIVSAQTTANGIEVQHRQRGSLVRHRLQVARVINCTGASLDVASSSDPLIQQLLEEGLARPHACGLGLDVDADGRVIDISGAPHANLATLGPLTQGAFWESTAVPEIRVHAARLAQTLSSQNQDA